MPARLKGKKVIVSGGASGIGAAHVKLFVAEGAKVIVADLQEELGGHVVADANSNYAAFGGKAVFANLDVTSQASWGAVVQLAREEFGGLTTLINNAGIYHAGGVLDESPEGWEKMIAVNQTGVWLGMRAVVPVLIESGNGAIVNISSLFGIVGSPGSLAYHATKGAVRLMSKSAALEFVADGVRVNSVHPGQIETPILANLTPELAQQIKNAIPMKRMGQPEDIARGSLYLCSDDACYVTGTELVIDGGWSAY